MSDRKNHRNPSNPEIWDAIEKLVSPISHERELGLSLLKEESAFKDSPLLAYLLATRTTDEDIEMRYHSIQILGKLLEFDGSSNECLSDSTLNYVHGFFRQIGKDQMVKILEVGVRYLAAENDLRNIFKICSFSGILLGGIVNDRKIPSPIRQQAIIIGGETGYVELVPVFQNLILRIDKNRDRPGRSLTKKLLKDEDMIYSSAVVALERLDSGLRAKGN